MRHFIEPFAGSLAVLLKRPEAHRRTIETVNDLDCHLANFWRSVQLSPSLVIDYADWPINEADLHARHRHLVERMTEERRELFKTDPLYHEPDMAGWWLWGLCMWIGGGWCELLVRRSPELGDGGRGILARQRRRPELCESRGVHAGGARVLRKRPISFASKGSPRSGVHTPEDWHALIHALRERLRHVKVICGDWKRVCTPAAIGSKGSGVRTAGVLLDPPYSGGTGRKAGIYAQESLTVAHDVRAWCLEHGGNPRLRIALCGLAGEHDALEDEGWEAVRWSASGGMGRGKDSKALARRHLETIWFSPHCLGGRQLTMFEASELELAG